MTKVPEPHVYRSASRKSFCAFCISYMSDLHFLEGLDLNLSNFPFPRSRWTDPKTVYQRSPHLVHSGRILSFMLFMLIFKKTTSKVWFYCGVTNFHPNSLLFIFLFVIVVKIYCRKLVLGEFPSFAQTSNALVDLLSISAFFIFSSSVLRLVSSRQIAIKHVHTAWCGTFYFSHP